MDEHNSKPGDPGYVSPEALGKHPDYKFVASEQGGFPLSLWHTVKHKPTGTFWQCCFSIRDDDSDYADPMRWFEVEAKMITVTKYVAKPPEEVLLPPRPEVADIARKAMSASTPEEFKALAAELAAVPNRATPPLGPIGPVGPRGTDCPPPGPCGAPEMHPTPEAAANTIKILNAIAKDITENGPPIWLSPAATLEDTIKKLRGREIEIACILSNKNERITELEKQLALAETRATKAEQYANNVAAMGVGMMQGTDKLKTLITDLRTRLQQAKARWVDPENLDDGEDMILEYQEFIVEALKKIEEVSK